MPLINEDLTPRGGALMEPPRAASSVYTLGGPHVPAKFNLPDASRIPTMAQQFPNGETMGNLTSLGLSFPICKIAVKWSPMWEVLTSVQEALDIATAGVPASLHSEPVAGSETAVGRASPLGTCRLQDKAHTPYSIFSEPPCSEPCQGPFPLLESTASGFAPGNLQPRQSP